MAMWRKWSAGGQRARIAQGVPFTRDPQHLLDAWAKVGSSVLLQAALFACVLYLFWPTRRRLRQWPDEFMDWHDALALRAARAARFVCYLMFGMSQLFFNHNSGICFRVLRGGAAGCAGWSAAWGRRQVRLHDLAQHPGAGLAQRRALSGGMPGLGGRSSCPRAALNCWCSTTAPPMVPGR